MTNDIYALHEKAFANVSAYIVLDKKGEHVARIALKFPKDGAGRLYAYVHFFGTQMVRGYAGGYGYDKRSAAVANAVRKIAVESRDERIKELNDGGHWKAAQAEGLSLIALQERVKTFVDTLKDDGGEYWDTRLRNAGFTVIQAV